MKTKLAALVVLGGIALGAVATTVFAAPPPEKCPQGQHYDRKLGHCVGKKS